MYRTQQKSASLTPTALALTAAALLLWPKDSPAQRSDSLANIAPGDLISSEAEPSEHVEEIRFRGKRGPETVAGRMLVRAQDGGVMLQSNDGALWTIQGDAVLSRKRLDEPFEPLDAEEMGERLLAELPPGFRVHTTPHFVICYDTSREYAEWTSSLFERLYKAFTNYWDRQGLEIREPEFPLAAIVYANRSAYAAATHRELGPAAGNIVGYYNLKSNRVNMYDLTGAEAVRGGNRRGSMREINRMLSRPAAVPLVATIVHEATHQITFNCGLQNRFADIPLWLCEGMAMYFEAPDLSSNRGWRGIGHVNYPRLQTFRRNLPRWQRGSLERMVADNRRFRNPRSAATAYADAWALNYYLIEYRSDDYAEYLKLLADKPPLVEDDPATRLREFEQHFGELGDLEQDFIERMQRVD